jgi:hypothetical protein
VNRLSALLLCALAALPALAHDPQLSSVTLRKTQNELRVSVLAPAASASGLEKRISLSADDKALELTAGAPVIDAERGTALLELRTTLSKAPQSFGLASRLFP